MHPQGFDSFGLPAEQYAIQTGQHPKKTTEVNIKRYRDQLDKMGFSFDWSREIRTSKSKYYKWTQWIFIKLFESYYDLNMEIKFTVPEISCGHCKETIEGILNSEKNINSASVDIEKKEVSISSDTKVSIGDLGALLDDHGYTVVE